MYQLLILPFILLIASVFIGFFVYFLYQKIKQTTLSVYNKSVEIASETHQQWKRKEQRKTLPAVLQKGFDDYDQISAISVQLPNEWKSRIEPLTQQAKQILDEISYRIIDMDAQDKKTAAEKKKQSSIKTDTLESMRTFFIHTMDALSQFVTKIHSDSQQMNQQEIDKAISNIQLLDNDLKHHQALLDKKRKFDFDVLMDVIKARLKT